jgi:cell division protein FtsB
MAQRRRPRRMVRVARQLAALAVLCAGLLLAGAFVGVTAQGNALARANAATRADIAAETARHAQLEATIAVQKTADYVTTQAREYGIVGPNEALVQVQRDGQASGTSVAVPAQGPTRTQRWVTFFFGSR